jgi:hypothetical protein
MHKTAFPVRFTDATLRSGSCQQASVASHCASLPTMAVNDGRLSRIEVAGALPQASRWINDRLQDIAFTPPLDSILQVDSMWKLFIWSRLVKTIWPRPF